MELSELSLSTITNMHWIEWLAIMLMPSFVFLLILLWRQRNTSQRIEFEALKNKDNQLILTLADNSTDVIYVKDLDGRYLLVNRETARVLAKPSEQILGQDDSAIFSAAEAAIVRTNDLRVIAENKIITHEETVTTVDGERTYLATKGPMRDSDGLVTGIFGISRDITERKQAENTLRQSEERLQLVIRGSGDAPWDWNLESGELYYSPRWWAMLGYIANELPTGASLWEHIVHPDDQLRVNQTFDNVIKSSSETYDIEFRLQHKNGHYVPVFSRGFILRDATGKPVRVSGTNTDLTERKQAEEKLQLSASVFSHSREGIMITDANSLIIEVNEAFSRITGFSREEALGKNPRILNSGRQSSEFFELMWKELLEHGHWNGELWNRHKNGQIYAEILNISAVQDSQGITQQYVALFSDITSLKEHESQLKHIAHFDTLTGLPNRVLLADHLRQGMKQAQRREQKLAVVFLDLDAFKIINDTHGHAAGDHLLKTVANRMKMALRESDTLARIGGDEFVAVLLDLDNTDASEPMLSRLIEAAAQPVHFDGLVLEVTASLGVTFYPQAEDVDADKLLRQSDQAMYLAKQEGGNCYKIFDAEQDRNVRGYNENLERIRQALNNSEFVLHYQPKVNMRNGIVIGVEALIRWQHPEKGLLPPLVFLPLIEDHLLAIEVGEWVIGTALTQIGLWQAAGLTIPVSINLGALQLQQDNFVQRLSELIGAHPNVNAADLQLEILETSALQDVAKVSQIIKACQLQEIDFALDDFGTGYSSLTYLKQLPVTLLKIDQSFVRDMLDDPDDLAILEGLISLAAAFRREVIAEGVETIEHGTVLLQLGCELAQGYGIAPPMSAQDIPNWVATWKPAEVWIKQVTVSRNDLSLVYAAVDHRAWLSAISHYIKGELRSHPPLNQHDCRFSKWLDAELLSLSDTNPAYRAIEKVHLNVHALAEELLALKHNDNEVEAIQRLDELHSLQDDFLQKLKYLRQ